LNVRSFDARAPTETGHSPKATSPAKCIHPKGYTICPQLQVTTLVSLSFAEIRGEKGFEKNKKPCFSLKITLPKLNRANAYFYSILLIQRGQTSLMFFIKSRPVAGEY